MNSIKLHLKTDKPENPFFEKPTGALRVLHTSDWHIGKMLYNQPRYAEFEEFLTWLNQQLSIQQVDILIIAGDIFDTMTPSNKAEYLYHQFLAKAHKSGVQHIIVVAGNHDSPTSLQKTKDVLGMLNVHVFGHISTSAEQDVLTLFDEQQTPLAIVLSVPFLRDRDVRISQEGQTLEQKNAQLLEGVAQHYRKLTEIAQEKQKKILQQYQKLIPIIATGHLFAAGASVSSADDGMRDLQVGTLGQISANIFDAAIDYVALGHIHAPQMVAKQSRIRYCGSPIAMGFGELGRDKQVLLIDFHEKKEFCVHKLNVPIFQSLATIAGDMPFIENELNKLKALNQSVWLEIEYIADELIANLRQEINQKIADGQLNALSVKNKKLNQSALSTVTISKSLEELNEMDVFRQRMEKENLLDIEKSALMQAYQQLIHDMRQQDKP